jgi:hypothetical protein
MLPNPFESRIAIGFNLPEASQATLTMYEGTAKGIRAIEIGGAKEYNQLSLASNELNASGVIYYQLVAGDYSATQKMMVIE